MNLNRRKFLSWTGALGASGLPLSQSAPPNRNIDLPDWVPQPGKVADVSRNTIADVQPCPTQRCVYSGIEGIQGIFAWCGGAIIQSAGKYGVLMHWGGGHAAYYGNEPYEFDIETRRWRRLKEPGLYGRNDDARIDDWGQYKDGEPACPHTYRGVFGLGPEHGGGPQGSLVQIGLAAVGAAALMRSGSFRFDREKKVWTKYAKALSPSAMSYAPVAFDALKGRFYAASLRQANWSPVMQVLDCKSLEWSQKAVSQPSTLFNAYSVMDYCPKFDCLVLIRLAFGGASVTNPQVWTVPCARLEEGWSQRATNSFEGELIPGHSMNWAGFLGKFALYNAGGEDVVYYLQAPTVITDRWRWSKEVFGGAAPDAATKLRSSGYTPSYNRFNAVEKLKCFAWYSRAGGPVQLWRPRTE